MAALKTFAVRLSFDRSVYEFKRVNATSSLKAIQKAFERVRSKNGVKAHESYGCEKTSVDVSEIGEPC
jgi:hypothetical protein